MSLSWTATPAQVIRRASAGLVSVSPFRAFQCQSAPSGHFSVSQPLQGLSVSVSPLSIFFRPCARGAVACRPPFDLL
eukprot:4721544-Alexandrium_andersonii.AAC.1